MKKAKRWLILLNVPHSITKDFPGHPKLARATFGLFIAGFSLIFALYLALFLNNDTALGILLPTLVAVTVLLLIIGCVCTKQYGKWHKAERQRQRDCGIRGTSDILADILHELQELNRKGK